jgi:hypothetical protein
LGVFGGQLETSQMTNDLDAPIWGAKAFAQELNLYKTDKDTGESVLDERAAFYIVESGRLGNAVTKVGRRLVSTPRKICQAIFGAENA